jgi:hypothetical protein
MEDILGSGGTAPSFLTLEKEPTLLDISPGGPYSQSVCYGEEINLVSAWNRTPAVQPVAYCYTEFSLLECMERKEKKENSI